MIIVFSDIIEWTQMTKQKKIDSVVRGFGFIIVLVGGLLISNTFVLFYLYQEHEITKRGFINAFPESMYL